MKLIITSIYLLLSTIVLGSQVDEKSTDNSKTFFFDSLQTVVIPKFDTSWERNEKIGYFLSQSKSINMESYTPAIIALWELGERSELELLWWKSNSSHKRILILSCFLSLTDESGDMQKLEWFPRFRENIDRFSAPESKLRKSEFSFVIQNKSHIAKKLARIAEKFEPEA